MKKNKKTKLQAEQNETAELFDEEDDGSGWVGRVSVVALATP